MPYRFSIEFTNMKFVSQKFKHCIYYFFKTLKLNGKKYFLIKMTFIKKKKKKLDLYPTIMN